VPWTGYVRAALPSYEAEEPYWERLLAEPERWELPVLTRRQRGGPYPADYPSEMRENRR
jgi:hypothetical protein